MSLKRYLIYFGWYLAGAVTGAVAVDVGTITGLYFKTRSITLNPKNQEKAQEHRQCVQPWVSELSLKTTPLKSIMEGITQNCEGVTFECGIRFKPEP